jgi:hypothetical protein
MPSRWLAQTPELWWVEPKLPATGNRRWPQLGFRENPMKLPVFRPQASAVVDDVDEVLRLEVNTGMFERIAGRIALPDRVGLENLLEVVGPGPTTPFNRLLEPVERSLHRRANNVQQTLKAGGGSPAACTHS